MEIENSYSLKSIDNMNLNITNLVLKIIYIFSTIIMNTIQNMIYVLIEKMF